jgi:D-xylose 1-dehydrogenase (NADP+, D-xylono-1,5-lactone-forming)
MSEPFRWGIVSTARINRRVIPAIRATSGAALVAVASREPSRARAYADEWEIPDAHGSYDELLARDDVDAVYISVPNHLHAALAIAAADAGKHVLCEKPLALTTADVDTIAEAAQRTGVVIAEAFMYRHHARTRRVQAIIASGRIGDVQLVRSSFSFRLDRPGDVRLDPAIGGGSLWDVGCYPVSLARTTIGESPVEVHGWQRLGPTGVDIAFWGTLCFPSGAVAQIDCGFAVPFRTGAEIVGTQGVIVLPRPFLTTGAEPILVGPSDDALTEEVVASDPELYRPEVEDLMAAARGERQPLVTLADSRANVATIVALYTSASDFGAARPELEP